MEMFDLSGKVAMVTGANGGIGEQYGAVGSSPNQTGAYRRFRD